MNTSRSNEKNHLKKLFEYRKNFNDPSFLLRKGTKRSLQKASRWKRAFQEKLNTALPYPAPASKELLASDYYEYYKIKHLVGLFHKDRSYCFKEQSVDFLVKLYDKWQKLAEKLDQEYFLKIWIFENYFEESQLVFALNNRIHRYASMFDDSTEDRCMPFISSNLQEKIKTFNVSFHKDYKGYSQDDLDEMPSKVLLEISKAPMIKKGLVEININNPVRKNLQYFLDNRILDKQTMSNGEPYYIAHIDNVWVVGK